MFKQPLLFQRHWRFWRIISHEGQNMRNHSNMRGTKEQISSGARPRYSWIREPLLYRQRQRKPAADTYHLISSHLRVTRNDWFRMSNDLWPARTVPFLAPQKLKIRILIGVFCNRLTAMKQIYWWAEVFDCPYRILA